MILSKWKEFLKDVFICSLGAYGGPEAHYSVFIEQMVIKKKYLNEEEFVELMALTGILPGPSSTQTIVSIGYKTGGPILALLTMLVWALPVVVAMTFLSFFSSIMGRMHIEKNIFRFISPMAVGFVIIASYRIGKKVIKGKTTFFLWCFGAITTYFIREPWIFPLVLIFGGIVSIFFSNEKGIWNKVYLNPSWRYLIIFLTLIIATLLSSILFDNRLISIFESFYRYGYLVIGGGQVVIPLMYGELVEINKYMTSQEFLTGFGLVQGLPGPMFSFSAFAGGLAARGNGIILQVAGALAGAIGIFLPGLLLIYFVYPLWEELKRIRGIKISLSGIIAVAGGLVFITSIILMQKISFSFTNISIVVLTVIALISKKIPSPLIVLFMIILGIIF